MPVIKGLTSSTLKIIPRKITVNDNFFYGVNVGKLILHDDIDVANYDSNNNEDSVLGLCPNWETLYYNGNYYGYHSSGYLKHKCGHKLRKPKIVELTRAELIAYKDNIFYNDATYDYAMELM